LYIYAAAGTDVASGGQLYDAAYVGKLPFTYPPFAGTVFMALSYLSENWLIIVWQGSTILALFTVFLLVFRERGYGYRLSNWVLSGLLTTASIAIVPFHGTLFFGQINEIGRASCRERGQICAGDGHLADEQAST